MKQMSHSSLNTILTCEAKFAHKYIHKTPYDPDYSEGKALNFGRAFHRVLEKCKHSFADCSTELIRQCCDEFNLHWENDGAKVAACLRSYFANINPSWQCLHTEVKWETDFFLGFIDGIFVDKDGNWIIVDMKTVGIKLDPGIKARLVNDQQMNLYMHHVPTIAFLLDLDVDKFWGVSYREVEKPRHRYKQDVKEKKETLELPDTDEEFFVKPTSTTTTRPETWEEFTLRCGNPPYRETLMRKEEFIFRDQIIANIDKVYARAEYLFENGASDACKNMQACKQFGSACQFWSQCYGMTHAECKAGATPTETPKNEPKGVKIDDADLF